MIDAPTEMMVIGTVMTTGEPAYRQVRFLAPDDFGVDRHRCTWREIVAVADDVHPTIDEIYHRVTTAGTLDSVGGLDYLLEMHRQAIPGNPLQGFGRTIRMKANQRRAWKLNSKLENLLASGSELGSPEFRKHD